MSLDNGLNVLQDVMQHCSLEQKAIADFEYDVRADNRQTGEGKKRCYIAEWSDTEELGRRASIQMTCATALEKSPNCWLKRLWIGYQQSCNTDEGTLCNNGTLETLL